MKQYSVLIHADELEAMAKDGETKEKYMLMIDNARRVDCTALQQITGQYSRYHGGIWRRKSSVR